MTKFRSFNCGNINSNNINCNNITHTGSVSPSDRQFKENITLATSQLDDVKQLAAKLVNYDWKSDAPVSNESKATRFLGLVAQEAETISPGLVTTIVTEDDDPTPDYKAIKIDVLLMKMLGAIGDLAAKVEALEAKA